MKNQKVLGAALLISGTTIGAGMLGLPLVTGKAGFLPAAAIILIYWLVMLYTSFVTLEATLWFPGETNFMTLAEKTMGKWGKAITWIFYLFLLYALTTAYLAGLNPLVLDFFHCIFSFELPVWSGYAPILILLGFFIYRGIGWVDHANRWMMLGLIATFLFILVFMIPSIKLTLLKTSDWAALPMSFSLLATAFGYHIVLPSIVTYLNHDERSCKKAIWIGSGIPVVVYLIWQWLSLGIIPLEQINGAIENGVTSGELLAEITQFAPLKGALRIFSFFLIVTSFLGVSLSLFDFLADGLKIKKTRLGRGTLFLLTFVPPLLICLINPHVFVLALDYAGAFGVIILLAIIPCLFLIFGRPKLAKPNSYRVKGGYAAFVLIFLFSLIVIFNELWI